MSCKLVPLYLWEQYKPRSVWISMHFDHSYFASGFTVSSHPQDESRDPDQISWIHTGWSWLSLLIVPCCSDIVNAFWVLHNWIFLIINFIIVFFVFLYLPHTSLLYPFSSSVPFLSLFFFDLGFTALSRIFHLYWANLSSQRWAKTGEPGEKPPDHQ